MKKLIATMTLLVSLNASAFVAFCNSLPLYNSRGEISDRDHILVSSNLDPLEYSVIP